VKKCDELFSKKWVKIGDLKKKKFKSKPEYCDIILFPFLIFIFLKFRTPEKRNADDA